MKPRQFIATYFVVQAVGTACWWALLLTVPRSINWFQPSDWPNQSLLGFWLSDLLLLIGGSLVVANAVLFQRAWATISIWSLAAAAWYPALYCVGVSVLTDEAWIASAMMVSMAGLTLSMATIHGHGTQVPAPIRATPMGKSSALVWTFCQTVIFWSAFLWIVPHGIRELETLLGLPAFNHSGQFVSAAAMFGLASVLGAWSAVQWRSLAMARLCPRQRHQSSWLAVLIDMSEIRWHLAGIMQGAAVGWAMGSWSVVGYAFAGALVWHWFVRPIEEADLHQRFQESYADYKATVWLWLPNLFTRYSD